MESVIIFSMYGHVFSITEPTDAVNGMTPEEGTRSALPNDKEDLAWRIRRAQRSGTEHAMRGRARGGANRMRRIPIARDRDLGTQ